jgi:diaminopimelate decarboxylase
MNTDVIKPSIQMPPLQIGEPLVISPAGAYNTTQWMQFIDYRPKVLMVHDNRQVSVLRRAENLNDINDLEFLPTHLAEINLTGV